MMDREPNLDGYTIQPLCKSEDGIAKPHVVIVHTRCGETIRNGLLAISMGYAVQLIHAHEQWCASDV